MDRKKLINRLILALALVAVVLLINTVINAKKKNSRDFEATSPALEEKWEMKKVGDTGLSLVVPSGMKEIQTKLDEKAMQVMDRYDAFEYKMGSFQFRINHIKSKADIVPKDYAAKLASMIERSPEFNSYTYEIRDVTESGLPSAFLKGSGMQNDIDMVINSLIMAKGTDLWEVTMIFNSANMEFLKLMERVFSSAVIEQAPLRQDQDQHL